MLVLLIFISSCSSLTSIFIPAIPSDAIMTPDDKNNWEIGNYVDSYGIDTDSMFVQTRFIGLFSNTATLKSECSGIFRINDDREVEILIYEYGTHLASGFGIDDIYNFTLWDSTTGEVLVKSSAWLGDNRFHVENTQNVINAIATHESVLCRLHGGKYTTSTYSFSFDASGFASDYQTII